jgi:hypothetical protein
VIAALVMSVVASAQVADGGMAIGLDDGTVWLVWDGEWEEVGGCDDGAVAALADDAGALLVECGDGSVWSWSVDAGWAARGDAGEVWTSSTTSSAEAWARPWTSVWLPELEVLLRHVDHEGDEPALEGWVRLRWSL